MERRNFLKYTGIGAAGFTLSWDIIKAIEINGQNEVADFQAIEAKWELHNDGSFDLVAGSVQINACYPQIDGKQIFPLAVNLNKLPGGGEIKYSLLDGKQLILKFSKDDNALKLETILKNFNEAPEWVHPIGAGTIEGANRLYKQGFGFAGPSGIFDIPEAKEPIESAKLKEDAWSYDSYLTSGLLSSENETVVLGAFDHANYLNKSTFMNKQSRFGLIDRWVDENIVLFRNGFATENIKVEGNELVLPAVNVFAGTVAFATFQQFAKALAAFNKVELPHAPRYHYCSWYDKEAEFSQQDLDELLDGLSGIKPAFPLQAIQIDAGYSYMGEWLVANERWPKGLEHPFKQIADAGYVPGVWVGPFMVNSNSFIYKEHKDWLLKDKNGEIITEWENDYHAGGSVHILDTSHPQAFEYLRKVFKQFRVWGVKMYKTDFMDWGYQDTDKVKRHTPGKTSAQYFNEVVNMIREEIGPESHWLGCISPFQPMVGKVDAIRLTNDVHAKWTAESTVNMFREMYYGQYFNNILWQNDPDVLYLRDYNNNFTREETMSVSLYDAILGGVVNTSDRFNKYNEEQLKYWRFFQPTEKPVNADLPFWSERDDVLVVVRKYEDLNAWGVLFVNIFGKTVQESFDMRDLVKKESAFVFEWGPAFNKPLGESGSIKIDLKDRSSRLFYVSVNENAPAANLTISGIKVKGLK